MINLDFGLVRVKEKYNWNEILLYLGGLGADKSMELNDRDGDFGALLEQCLGNFFSAT